MEKTSKYAIQNILQDVNRLQYQNFDKVGMAVTTYAFTNALTGERCNDLRVDVMGGERVERFEFSVRNDHEELKAEYLRMRQYIADLAFQAELEIA